MYEAMEQYLDSKAEPEPPEDVDFEPYSPEWMFETGNNFVEFGILPFAGAWEDQPADWIDALHKWLALRRYLSRDDKKGESDPFRELAAESGEDWTGMMND